MSQICRVRADRAKQRKHGPRLRVVRCPSNATFAAPIHVIVVLSGVSFSMQPMRHWACSSCAFALRPALHSAPHLATSFLCILAHVRVCPHVQTACPEGAMSMAWLAFAGRSAAPCAAPPGHRLPVPSGRGKMQGKIKGSGTLPVWKRVCTWGGRGTRQYAAPCRGVPQSLAGIGETACLSRFDAMAFAGAAT